MQIICLEEDAFYELVNQVVESIKGKEKPWKWVNSEEAMSLLSIKSKTTLQQLRDTGSIKFSQPMKKIILYDIDSINDFLEQNTKEVF